MQLRGGHLQDVQDLQDARAGCGAFENDPSTTALAFWETLAGPLAGAFREVVFAITDWSLERRFLGPFAEVFAG